MFTHLPKKTMHDVGYFCLVNQINYESSAIFNSKLCFPSHTSGADTSNYCRTVSCVLRTHLCSFSENLVYFSKMLDFVKLSLNYAMQSGLTRLSIKFPNFKFRLIRFSK